MGTKSAQKQVRVSGKRQTRNKAVKSLAKTRLTRAQKLVATGELETARGAVLAAISSLDKAAEKAILHPNNTARRKSRLMKRLNKAQAAPKTEKEKAK